MVHKKPQHRRLRGDWSLKNINNMADSSEKVSFRVDMQCSSLRAKAFLVFDRGSQPIGGLSANSRPTLYRHAANKLPTCCQQSADCWQKIFVKGGKLQSADSWSTVGQQLADCRPAVDQQSADCWPTVGRLLVNSRPTVGWGSCSSFFPCILATLLYAIIHWLSFRRVMSSYESTAKQPILFCRIYSSIQMQEAFEFFWSSFANEHNTQPKSTRRNVKLNKFASGTQALQDLLHKHLFTSSVWNFCH